MNGLLGSSIYFIALYAVVRRTDDLSGLKSDRAVFYVSLEIPRIIAVLRSLNAFVLLGSKANRTP
jgi:hypothetical protein